MKNNDMFYIFGLLQAITLALILFFVLQTANIGTDTSIVLSGLFSACTLVIEYLIYSKK
jgi:Ca2+/Na+ antiporter